MPSSLPAIERNSVIPDLSSKAFFRFPFSLPPSVNSLHTHSTLRGTVPTTTQCPRYPMYSTLRSLGGSGAFLPMGGSERYIGGARGDVKAKDRKKSVL